MTDTQKYNGFTLIEVIITIVIVVILGLMIFTFIGNVLTRSHEPIILVQELAEAVEIIESFSSNYERYLESERGRENFSWTDFVGTLTGEGVSHENRKGTGDFDDVDFDVIEVVVTRGSHTVSVIFTELVL